jgi:DUF4097 and DUF4098 domain-containing protein YvlB
MKKYILSLIAIVHVSLSMAQEWNPKDPFQTKSLAKDIIKNIEVETSGGNITVIATTAADPRIEVYVSPGNSRDRLTKEELTARLNNYELNVDVKDNTLIARAKPKQRNMDWKQAVSVAFKIFVPANVSTDLTTSGGNIQLSGLTGKLEFVTSGGNLDLEKLSGNIKGVTSGGNIYVKDSREDIDLTTSGGNITATHCDGKIKLHTSGGSVTLSFLKGETLANTSGGNINGNDVEGELDAHTSGGNVMLNSMRCDLATSTSGGDIHVEMKEVFKYVKVANSSGHTDLVLPAGKGYDLDISGDKITTDKLENFAGKTDDENIDGKLNGGGTRVKVNGGGGRVYLAFSKN